MASQQNSTTQVLYLKAPESHTYHVHTGRGHMTRHSSHTNIQAHAEANSLSTDTRKKEGFSKPVYLHRALHGSESPPGWQVSHRCRGLRKTRRRGGVVF